MDSTTGSYPTYPLYDLLKNEISKRAEKSVDINKVCATINNISRIMTPEQTNEHYREIQALIIHHYLLTRGILNHIPYEGKVMIGGKGVLNYIANMPPELQQIIAHYIEYTGTN